ncbi:hypothetical protein GCM10010252_49660 [Streptomyces aureoverticillatus]|nr:hypothetical protein GCM10010252_49660 [Streptomyces aureoverticillatus]
MAAGGAAWARGAAKAAPRARARVAVAAIAWYVRMQEGPFGMSVALWCAVVLVVTPLDKGPEDRVVP